MDAAQLLTALRVLNIRVRLDGDVIRCKPPAGASIPPDLVDQIRALKPGLLALLTSEQQEIDWRAETIGTDLLGAGGERMPGACSYCGLSMPGQQTGKCVLCVLAAMQVSESGRATYPHSSVFGEHSETKLSLWDMSRDINKDAA